MPTAILAFVLLSGPGWTQPVQTLPRLVLSTLNPLDSPSVQVQIRLYTEALRRLGRTLEVVSLPPARGSAMADSGEIDGELTRGSLYGKDHPNLVMVEEPSLVTEFIALTKNRTLKLDGWDSLTGTGLRVEYLLGAPLMKERLEPRVPPGLLSSITSSEQGLKKLESGRTDVYIDVEASIAPLLDTAEARGAGIVKAGTMERVAVHAYLHKKNALLARDLARVLAQMRREGVVDKILRGP